MDNYLMGSGLGQWKEGKAYEITFIVTEDCNLRCTYCYQAHKNNKHKMTFDIAKKAVDYVLGNPQIFDAEAVLWDFIGGEPLLEIELIDKIVDYIKINSYKSGHKWAKNYRINIGTNGILYDRQNVQRFIKKNKDKLNIGITIDGTKEKHDMHRVYCNGKGSYDDVMKNVHQWKSDFPNSTTKVTFSSEDLPYLKESIIHLWESGISVVPANVVFENVWKEHDDEIYEKQLRELADYVIENELWNKVNCTLFDDNIGKPNDNKSIHSNYCGTGRMLAIDSQGNFYPCLRFSDFSLSNKKGIDIGNIYSGIDYDKIRPFLALSTKVISTDECINCEIASGCGWCQGCNYDCDKEDTIYSRVTYICKMHKARVRANNYYWDKLLRDKGIHKKNRYQWKKHLYFIMSNDAVECCNYHANMRIEKYMDEETAKKGLEICEKNFYKPVILNSRKEDNILNLDNLSDISRIEICDSSINLPYKNFCKYVIIEKDYIDEFEGNDIVLLYVEEDTISNLADRVKKVLKSCKRINVIFKFDFTQKHSKLYQDQLELILEEIIGYLKNNEFREVNVITDRLFLNEMNNCNCGMSNYALAPNGKIYVCPAFYFDNPDNYIGDIKSGIMESDLFRAFSIKNAPICNECDAFQCNRCIFENKKKTREYNIPGSSQCIKSHIERNISMKLQKTLKAEKISYGMESEIRPISYNDPIELLLNKMEYNPFSNRYC